MAPVVEYQQTRVDDAVAHERSRTDVIDRLVYRGVGIEVGTELDTDALTPGNNAGSPVLAGEVLGAVEGHVLQEVRQSSLTRFLKNRPYALSDVKIGQPRLFCIVADVVGHAVLEFARAHTRVLR